jgi:chromosome segregation ATPase
MITAAELKQTDTQQRKLATEISDLQAEAKTLKDRESAVRSSIQAKQSELKRLREKVEKAKATGGKLIVTEHAILRYIERVMGINLDELRATIVPPAVETLVRNMGDGVYPVEGTHKLRVVNGTVVSLLGLQEPE